MGENNHETFLIFFIFIYICSMTDRQTNKVNNILDAHIFPIELQTDGLIDTMNYRVAPLPKK